MSRTSQRDNAEQRRSRLATLVDAQMTQREMAGAIKVAVSTVNADLKILRAQWTKTQIGGMDNVMVEDLHRIASAMQAIWAEVAGGNLFAIDRLVKLTELRARLLGYEPPRRLDITSGGRPIKSVSVIVARLPEEGSSRMEIPMTTPSPMTSRDLWLLVYAR